MPRVLYGNFDFEHELAQPDYVRSKKMRRLNAYLSPVLIALAKPHDAVVFPEPVSEVFRDALADAGFPRVHPVTEEDRLDSFEGMPWGWSDSARNFLRERGATVRHPDLNVVARLNSREWSHDTEWRKDTLIPGAKMLACRTAFEEAVRSAANRWQCDPAQMNWVVKPVYSMSGRGRIRGKGLTLTTAQENWFANCQARSEPVFFEPWVSSVREFGIQCEVPRNELDLMRMLPRFVEQFTNSAGQFTGCRILDAGRPADVAGEHWAEMVLNSIKLIRWAIDEQYQGPLGIDAMTYRSPDGEDKAVSLRPMQDINARFTMGRVATSTASLMKAKPSALWLCLTAEHVQRLTGVRSPSEADAWYRQQGVSLTEPVARQHGIRDEFDCCLTTPLFVGSEPASAFVLVSSSSPQTLEELRDSLS